MSTSQNGDKTFLLFNQPVGFAPKSSQFELVYSSGIDSRNQLVMVGKYVSSTGGNAGVSHLNFK
jgi:hypothetical protein